MFQLELIKHKPITSCSRCIKIGLFQSDLYHVPDFPESTEVLQSLETTHGTVYCVIVYVCAQTWIISHQCCFCFCRHLYISLHINSLWPTRYSSHYIPYIRWVMSLEAQTWTRNPSSLHPRKHLPLHQNHPESFNKRPPYPSD